MPKEASHVEARYNLHRLPIQPILVALTVVFALVLGLLAGYAAARIDSRPPALPTVPRVASQTGFEGPDAIERNEQLRIWMAQDTHGH
jgi:hypothetical protein